jgi:hypothetical protein
LVKTIFSPAMRLGLFFMYPGPFSSSWFQSA